MQNAKFKIGDTFTSTCIFTGGIHKYIVKAIVQEKKNLVCHSIYNELDGTHELTDTFRIHEDKQGNEYIVLWEYNGEEGRYYAQGKS